MNDFDISVTCFQEHRQDLQEDRDIKATNIGRSTMFTRNRQGAVVGGVGVVVKSTLL